MSVKTVFMLGFIALGVLACTRQNKQDADRVDSGVIHLEPDDVLISIDGNNLTYGQAIRQVEAVLGGPPPQGMDPEHVTMIERRTFNAVVDDFIRREMLLAQARRLGIEPEEEHIATALREIEKRAKDGITPSSLYYEGPDSIRREITAGLTMEKLLAQELPPFTAPDEAEIAAFLERNPARRIAPARANARHIFVAVPRNASESAVEQLLANMEDTRMRLEQGADFAQTASMISQDSSAARGGNLGVVVQGRGDPLFEQAVFSQPIGEIGPVVRSNDGFHIIQVLHRTEQRAATEEEIVGYMQRDHRAEALQAYVRELMQKIEMRHSPAIQPLTAAQ